MVENVHPENLSIPIRHEVSTLGLIFNESANEAQAPSLAGALGHNFLRILA